MALTQDESEVVAKFIYGLGVETIVQIAVSWIPQIVEGNIGNFPNLMTYLNAKSVSLQAELDGLTAKFDAEETRLTDLKTVVDGLITKLTPE